MPHSFADQLMLTCPQCGTFFTPDVWLIIDTAERPDLPALILDGAIHRFACPNGHMGEVDAPLLIFRPDQTPPLLFAPAARTTAEQDRAMVEELLGRLAESLGDAWRAEWLRGVLTLPRRLLAEALDSEDAAALLDRALADAIPPGVGDTLGQIMTGLANEGVRLDSAHDLESALAARPALRERLEAAMRAAGAPASPAAGPPATPQPRQDSLLAALRQFVEAETWLDSYRFVRDHPELLSDAAEARLAALAERAAATEEDAIGRLFAEHLALLRRAREVGVERAFAEKLGIAPEELIQTAD